nr:hypothetical protein [Xanthomonas campestris]
MPTKLALLDTWFTKAPEDQQWRSATFDYSKSRHYYALYLLSTACQFPVHEDGKYFCLIVAVQAQKIFPAGETPATKAEPAAPVGVSIIVPPLLLLSLQQL